MARPKPYLLLLVSLTILLGPLTQQLNIVEASHQNLLGVWSDDYGSHAIVDPAITMNTNFQVDINVTNLEPINGFDITLTYDQTLIRVPSSTRLGFDANGEDTIVSVTPVREPTLAERSKPLSDFDPTNSALGAFPAVKFIDLDSNGKYLIGETLVLDNDNSSTVNAGDQIVSETPTRPPTLSEMGQTLLFTSLIRFDNTTGVSGAYEPGVDVLVFDHNEDFIINQPQIAPGVAAPTCHFYEGCLFDNTPGTPLAGRRVDVLARSCDAGCAIASPGSVRLALVLYGQPQVQGTGTLFQILFQVVASASGSTGIGLQETIVASEGRSVPHTRRDGFFSNKQVVHEVGLVSLHTSAEKVFPGQVVNISIVAGNFGTENETVVLEVRANAIPLQSQTLTMTRDSSVSLLLSWNTTSFAVGVYVLNATLILSNDEIPRDNSLTTSVRLIKRDLAIQSLALPPTAPRGTKVNITTTIANLGTEQETFNLTLTSDSTEIGRELLILPGGQTRTILVEWHTTGVLGTKTITASVPVLEGESNPTDNQASAQTVIVNPAPLTLNIIANPMSGEPPLTVTFNAQIAGGVPSYTVPQWDLGGGLPVESPTVSRTYNECGIFTTVASVADSLLTTVTASISIRVTTTQRFLVIDLNQKPLGNVNITILTAPPGQGPLTTVTGPDGRAELKAILAGNYTARLTAKNFETLDASFETFCRTPNEKTLALFPEPRPPSPPDNWPAVLVASAVALVSLGGAFLLLRRKKRMFRGRAVIKHPRRESTRTMACQPR